MRRCFCDVRVFNPMLHLTAIAHLQMFTESMKERKKKVYEKRIRDVKHASTDLLCNWRHGKQYQGILQMIISFPPGKQMGQPLMGQ